MGLSDGRIPFEGLRLKSVLLMIDSRFIVQSKVNRTDNASRNQARDVCVGGRDEQVSLPREYFMLHLVYARGCLRVEASK